MHRITLTIILLFAATFVDAASYQKTDGTIVDPIQSVEGGDLPYSGNNLEPVANLRHADLYYADLRHADLRHADLAYADLAYANLENADLTYTKLGYIKIYNAYLGYANLGYADLGYANLEQADLTNADLHHASLENADFTEANLSGSNFSAVFYYPNSTWTDAFYYAENEPIWGTGMDEAWRSSVGIVEISSLGEGSPVPEPSTLLLALLGLALVPRRRRRTVAIKTLTTLKTV